MFTDEIFMGQEISHVGDENLGAVRECGTRAELVEAAKYGHLSSRVEKLIRLAQSSLASRVYGRFQPEQNSDKEQQVLHERSSMIAVAPVAASAACNIFSTHFNNIPAVDLSYDTDVGVARPDVLLEPVGLHCHIPVRKVHKVDTCTTTDCRTADADCHHNHNTRENIHDECLLSAGPSSDKAKVFNLMNDGGDTVNGIDATKSHGSSEIFFGRQPPPGVSATAGVYDADYHSRSRPPHKRQLITPVTVLQSACESRPSEIGSYLAVAPLVSSSDLGLSPIDETTEVLAAATTSLCNTFDTDGSCEQCSDILSNCHPSSDALRLRDHTRSVHVTHASELAETGKHRGTGIKKTSHRSWPLQDNDTVFSNRSVMKHAKSNVILPHSTPVDSLQCSVSLSEDDSFCSSQFCGAAFAPVANAASLLKNNDPSATESGHCDVCFAYREPELGIHRTFRGSSNRDASAFDPVWTEWETALSCCDFSCNNNESGSPRTMRVNKSSSPGPLMARYQVRHSSDGSAPLSSSLPSTTGDQLKPLAARSTSQLSLDDVIVSPHVPERLDFQQLEKFEGRCSVVC